MATKPNGETRIFNFDELRGWDDLSVNIDSDPEWTLVDNGKCTEISVDLF